MTATRLFAFALVFVLSVAGLRAQESPDINGTWNITQGTFGTSNYGGTVSIAQGPSVCLMKWNSEGSEFIGFGRMIGNDLYVAWSRAENFGFVLYTIVDDSVLQGVWGLSGNPEGQGEEYAHGGSVKAKTSRFHAVGKNPDGSNYTGTLDVSHEGDVYQFVWRVNDDVYYGDGLRVGNKIVVGWGGAADNFGAIHYVFSGNAAKGRFILHGSTEIGIENLARATKGRTGR